MYVFVRGLSYKSPQHIAMTQIRMKNSEVRRKRRQSKEQEKPE